MKCVRKLVNLSYDGAEQRRIFRHALDLDVDKGGRYDARSAAINVWSRDWGTHEDKALSQILVTLYFAWGNRPRLWAIEWANKVGEDRKSVV